LFGVIATSHEAFRAAYLFAVGRRPIFGIRKPTITEHNRPITGAPSDATQKLFASVAESARADSAHSRFGPRPGRPWLRLVRAGTEDLGPVSPELALVDPPLAATVRLTPDAVVVAETESTVQSNVIEPWRLPKAHSGGHGPTTTVRYDTRDLLLERHGLTLELKDRGSVRTWCLTAARGENVEAAEDGPGVPRKLEALLRNVIHGDELVQVPVRSSDPQIRRLEDHVAKQHQSLLRYDVGTRIGSDPESLHQLRVAARRLRAFLGVARDLVDSEWAGEIKEGMRDLGRASNNARDLDILLGNLREQIRSLDVRDQAAGAALIDRFEADRRELQKALVAALDSGAYQRVLDQLALPALPGAATPAPKLDVLAARELRRLVVRVRRLGKQPTEGALHALRIKVKKVRYATELGGEPSEKQSARVIAAATRMQDILGAHQDAVVTEERLRALARELDETGISFVAGRLAERERRRRDDIHDGLPASWKELRKVARKLD
jgi:CHAD domain-containing protein